MLSMFKIFNNFLPLIWSNDPWETPIVRINIRQIVGEIIRFLLWSIFIEIRLTNKKKIKEW